MAESHVYQCPECEVFFQTTEPLPPKPFHLCSYCRMAIRESDGLEPRRRAEPDVDYPLFKNRHKP